jgi:hypothetical protein
MRTGVWVFLPACLLLALTDPVLAAEQEEIQALVQQAIKARGGEARLAQLQAAVWKTRGSFNGRTSRATLYGQLPDKFRLESESVVDGKTVRFVRIVNGDRGWVLNGSKGRPMSAEELAQVKGTFDHKNLDTTLLGLRESGADLSLLGESRVGGRPVIGLKVRRRGRPDLALYFDKETKLLLKSRRQVKDGASGRLVTLEYFYDDYQDFGGVKIARKTRQVRDGKVFAETDVQKFEPRKRLESHLFMPPAGLCPKTPSGGRSRSRQAAAPWPCSPPLAGEADGGDELCRPKSREESGLWKFVSRHSGTPPDAGRRTGCRRPAGDRVGLRNAHVLGQSPPAESRE